MPIFRVSSKKNITQLSWLLLLCIFCGMTGLAQKTKQPIGSANCEALKQQYAQAIKAGNGALVNQLGQELIKLGCYDQPKPPPALPVLHH